MVSTLLLLVLFLQVSHSNYQQIKPNSRLTRAQISDWSADETIAAIHSKSITTSEYIDKVLEEIKRINCLNAFVTVFETEAREEAKKWDAVIARGKQLPPLAGLAIVVKDNINIQGRLTTAGTPALRNAIPKTTAPSLIALINAGVIVVGKTNMHEIAFGVTSTDFFTGPVKNPYNLTRIPGGSSGGNGAAIAARVVSAGIGTDTGGSTRIPAALTGIAGYRPSVGNGGADKRYHDEGAVVPVSFTRDTVGIMARSVLDITLLDSVIMDRPRVKSITLEGLRMGVPTILWSGLDNSVSNIVMKARDKLTAAGVIMVDVDMPMLLELNNNISFQIALHEPIFAIPSYLNASGINGVTLQDIAGKVASPDVKKAFESVIKDVYGGEAYNDAINNYRPALQQLYADYFKSQNVDALLFPTTIVTADLIDREGGSGNTSINGIEQDTFLTYIRNTDPGSNAGIPGLSVPAGMNGDLPVGIEIDGPLGSDEKLFAIGLAMEKLFGSLPAPPRSICSTCPKRRM